MLKTEARMRHFLQLTPDQQEQAIRRLVMSGYSETTVAQATGLSREFVAQVVKSGDGVENVTETLQARQGAP